MTQPPPDRRKNVSPNVNIDSVVAEYYEAVDRGEDIEKEAWLRRYPSLADELREFFSAELAIRPSAATKTRGDLGKITPRNAFVVLIVGHLPILPLIPHSLISSVRVVVAISPSPMTTVLPGTDQPSLV